MSRCFPFPPLGFERQHRLEDLILSKEAKHKDKKEKREKNDKDKKKDKEKKEKHGSEKRRDKKDRKGKHKDKKEKHGDKEKDKDDCSKDKEKSSISVESTIAGKFEERSAEKVHPEVNNKYSSVEYEGKCSTFFQGQNGKPIQGILPSQAPKEARFMQELDRPIRGNEKGRGKFLQRVNGASTRDQEAAGGTAFRYPSQVLAEEKHSDGDKSFQGKKLELQVRNGVFIGMATVQNLTALAKSKSEGIPRPLEERDASRLEENEKYKETGGSNFGEKQKVGDKKYSGKDKHKKKEKKKEEKANNVNIENEKVEPQKSKISGRNDLAGAACNRSVNMLMDATGTAVDEGSIRKRKGMDTNGFLHESEIRPNKVQTPAFHQYTENGRKLETSSKSFSIKHFVPNNVRLDQNGRLNNGILEAKKPSSSKPNPSGINMFSDQIAVPPKAPDPDFSHANESLSRMPKKDHSAEASKRPPHPDSKYLNQILTVPKIGDWSEDDDQEWLFCRRGPTTKPVSEPVVTEEMHVWSEAQHIESADIYALPYVIPY